MLATDGFFILATVLNLIFSRKNKAIVYFNIFSIVIISIAVILKFFNIEYPKWTIALWDFYILIFYGIQVIPNIAKYINSKVQN